jgi:hypothetical protein
VSRGLGRLQVEILERLQPTGWVTAYGHRFEPAPHVYDLRAVLPVLTSLHNAYSHCRFVRPAFQASFSRAVRGLLRRGVLARLSLVPVIERDERAATVRFLELADGLYFNSNERQSRFVTRLSVTETAANAVCPRQRKTRPANNPGTLAFGCPVRRGRSRKSGRH